MMIAVLYFPFSLHPKSTGSSMMIAKFSTVTEAFANLYSLCDYRLMEPKQQWVLYGSPTPNLQALALNFLGQPCFSSSYERNWCLYSFIYSFKKSKLTKYEQMIWFIQIPTVVYNLEIFNNIMKGNKIVGYWCR